MTIQYLSKKTNELSQIEKSQFLKLRSMVSPTAMAMEQFDAKYLQTPLGYSYHGLMLDGDSIVGACNMIPYAYRYFRQNVMFAQSVDLMIHPEYRKADVFALLKVTNLVTRAAKQDGIAFVFGVPNEESVGYTRKFLRWRAIGELDIYALPVNMGAFSKKLSFLDVLFQPCMNLWVRFPSIPRHIQAGFPIEKIDGEAFERQRYNSRHGFLALEQGGKSRYFLSERDNGNKELFIIDIVPLTPLGLAETVRKLFRLAVVENANSMIYVGNIPFSTARIVRIPHFLRRSRRVLYGRILNPQIVDEQVYEIVNWNFNLSNMDVP